MVIFHSYVKLPEGTQLGECVTNHGSEQRDADGPAQAAQAAQVGVLIQNDGTFVLVVNGEVP